MSGEGGIRTPIRPGVLGRGKRKERRDFPAIGLRPPTRRPSPKRPERTPKNPSEPERFRVSSRRDWAPPAPHVYRSHLPNAQRARPSPRRARAIPAFFAPDATLDVGRFGVTDGFGTVGREIEQAIRDLAEERFLADVADWRKAIEAHPVNGKAVPSADRGKRLAAITRKRHELEQREEAIVLSAERDGLDLDRRADASPAVVVCTVLAEDAAA